MKKILLTALCVCLAWGATAQKRGNVGKQCTLVSLGGTYALPLETGFDKMLDDYNLLWTTPVAGITTSPDVSPFQKNTPFMGGALAFTSYGNHGEARARMWYEIGLRGALRNMSARNIFGEGQSIEQGLYSLHVGLGMLPIQRRNFDLAVALTLENGTLNTNANGSFAFKNYAHSQWDYFGAVSFNLPMYVYFGDVVSLGIRPFAQAQFNQLEFRDFQKSLLYNGLDYSNDQTKSQFHNYGVHISLNFVFSKMTDIR